jgi:hypothetical protein
LIERDLQRQEDAGRFWPGHTSTLQCSSLGAVHKPHAGGEWEHPWQLSVAFEEGEWRARINPGFVNARPPFVHMPARWLAQQVNSGASTPRDFGINPLTGKSYFSAWVFRRAGTASKMTRVGGPGGTVRITHTPRPFLALDDWRNPAASATITADGRAGAAEGYPDFFAELGVVPPSAGGPLATFGQGGFDGTGERVRELRVMDVVLRQPRASTGLFVQETNPIGTTAFLQFATTYSNAPDTRATLRAVREYQPVQGAPNSPGPGGIPGIFGFLLNLGDSQFDEILMSRVWMVSPPGAGEDAVPDASWEPYAQHFVFWNLNWANRVAIQPDLGPQLIQLPVPIVGAVAQPLIDALLALVNQGFSEAINFLAVELAARMSGGRFWTT